jgi:hypothetical protein
VSTLDQTSEKLSPGMSARYSPDIFKPIQMENSKNFDEQETPIITERFLSELDFLLHAVNLAEVSKMLRKMVFSYMEHEFKADIGFECIVVDHFGELEFLFDFFDTIIQEYPTQE